MQIKRLFSSVAAATALLAAVASSPAQAIMVFQPMLPASGSYADVFTGTSGFVTFGVSATSFATLGLYSFDSVIKTVSLTSLTTGESFTASQSAFDGDGAVDTDGAALYDTAVLTFNSLSSGAYKLSWTVAATGSPYEMRATFGTAQVAVVPEPEVYSMAFAGLVVAGLAVRRRQRAAA